VPSVLGVLNVTPDSFSDGGQHASLEAAVRHGLQMAADGADWVDVGGESTRPGAQPVAEAEELRRVIPVVEALVDSGVPVSIDTRKEVVARAAIAAGATILNDVSASLAGVAAELGVGWIAMHAQGDPATMQDDPRYDDVVAEVQAFLVERADAARAAGCQQVWIDPGIGFGKTLEHNLALLGRLPELVATGHPVVLGASRKGFLGRLLGASDRTEGPAPVEDRLEGSLATATWAFACGADAVRAHDVRAARHAAHVVAGQIEDEAAA
jgi:dihydropteroate synthase